MGTIEQPNKIEDGMGFYEKNEKVHIFEGPQAVVACYNRICGHRGTVALRDFYQAWAAVGNKSHGGKPFFLGQQDPGMHMLFFDDHITPGNAKIVDPINGHLWPRRYHSSQLYGTNLVQVQPMQSIMEKDYFLNCIHRCEVAR